MLKFGGFTTLTRGRHLGTYGRQNLRFDVRDGSDPQEAYFSTTYIPVFQQRAGTRIAPNAYSVKLYNNNNTNFYSAKGANPTPADKALIVIFIITSCTASTKRASNSLAYEKQPLIPKLTVRPPLTTLCDERDSFS